MTKHIHATGHIEVQSYEALPFDQPGGQPGGATLNELRVTEAFTGDIVGQGSARMLQAQRADGSASFVALERVVGTLAGKRGSFVLQDEGALVGTRVTGRWFVVAGSGTEGITGLRGEGGFEAELGQRASYTLDYWFE